MTIAGPTYPFGLEDPTPLLLFGSLQTALPPAYPTVELLRLRDSAAHTKLRIAVDDISAVAQVELGYGLWLKRIGSPVGYVWIESGTTATPNTAPGALTLSTLHFDVAALSDTDWTYVAFPDVVTPIGNLGALHYQWLVLAGDFNLSAVNTVAIAAISSPPPLGSPDAGYYQYDGAAWSNSASNLFASGAGGRSWDFQRGLAQVFTMTATLQLSGVRLLLSRIGAPVGSLWLEIKPVKDYGSPVCYWPPEFVDSQYSELSGAYSQAPNSAILGTSRLVDSASLDTTPGQVEFLFDTAPLLQFNTRYAFVLKCSATLSAINNIGVGVDFSSSYEGGSLMAQPLLQAQPLQPGGGFDLIFGSLVFNSSFSEVDLLSSQLGRLGAPPQDVCDLPAWLSGLLLALQNYFPAVIPELYGGTGESHYAKGDLLYAVSIDNLSKLPIGPSGTVLTTSVDGLPEWAKGGGQILERFWNSDSMQIDPGELVVYSSAAVASPGAFRRSTVPALDTANFCGVAVEPITPGTQGFICTYGPVQVRLSGTAAVDDALFMTTTLGRAVVTTTARGLLRALQAGTDGQLIWAFVSGQAVGTPAGSMVFWPTTTIPYGWLAANGQLISRTTYAKLFAVIGTSFGAGDGTTTYALPDLRGRQALGMDNMGNGAGAADRIVNANADLLGGSGGEENHLLTIAEMPVHAHNMGGLDLHIPGVGTDPKWGGASLQTSSNGTINGDHKGSDTERYDTALNGEGLTHNNMSPWLSALWIIRFG